MNRLQMVQEFMEKHDQKGPDCPELPSFEVRRLRYRLFDEEFLEFGGAATDENLIEVLDALVDLEYVLLGTVVAYGMKGVFEEAFRRVHENNMLKPLREDKTQKVQKTADHPKVDLSDLV